MKSGTIRNSDSACVSFPGQLKRVSTGESATQDLEKGTAIIDAAAGGPVLGASVHPPHPSASARSAAAAANPLSGLSEVEGEEEEEEESERDNVGGSNSGELIFIFHSFHM